MRKLILFLLFVPLISLSQDYYVSAKGGLNVREGPDAKAKKLSTLPYGTFVSIESRTAIKLTINDTELTFTNIFGLEDEVRTSHARRERLPGGARFLPQCLLLRGLVRGVRARVRDGASELVRGQC